MTSGLSSMKEYEYRGFPEVPVVKTLSSDGRGTGLISGWGAKISCILRPKNKNIKQEQYCNKFNKGFKKQKHFLLFYVLVFCPRGLWDLTSLTRDRTPNPCIGR